MKKRSNVKNKSVRQGVAPGAVGKRPPQQTSAARRSNPNRRVQVNPPRERESEMQKYSQRRKKRCEDGVFLYIRFYFQ